MMTARWIVLITALAIGIGSYLWFQQAQEPELQANLLAGAEGPVDLYNPEDPRIRVLYFGYTRCPDVCPTSLAMLAAALKDLPEAQLVQLWPVFISLDPERDSGAQSAQYAHYFHPALTGMSGTPEQIKALAERYGVIYVKTQLDDSALGYAVDHSSYFYFIQPDGTLIEKVPHTLNPAIIVAAMERVLATHKESNNES